MGEAVTLGVLGTMVWDRIDHPDGEVVERWGGISYSLAALAAAAPEGWTIRPLIRLGADLADRGRAFLASLPQVAPEAGVVEVPEPNNRVYLRYTDRHDRDEQLTGGVGPWPWSELEPRLQGLDALYVNLISGFELEPETAATLAERPEPRYVDIHSLVLAVDTDGGRVPRRPERADVWLDAFDVVQLNEREATIMAGDFSPEVMARSAIRDGAAALLVTRGPRGAGWFARADAPIWPRLDAGGGGAAGGRASRRSAAVDGDGTVRSGEVPLEATRTTAGDPTGCGDVWGATCFAHLVRGRRLSDAMARANRAAARNVNHRGAEGLFEHLRGDA